MRSTDSKTFTALTATTASFQLQGGYYALTQNGDTFTSSNHIDLQILGPDDSTNWVVALAGVQTGSSGYTAGYLPAGTYRFAVSGTLNATNVRIARIPFD